MVQDFSMRYPLIDGQGNFGSVDGDAPAAMRYTEARMAAITAEMIKDIEKQTVDFSPNFDATLKEPVVLPAALPNLLINGSSGIAVGTIDQVPFAGPPAFRIDFSQPSARPFRCVCKVKKGQHQHYVGQSNQLWIAPAKLLLEL